MTAEITALTPPRREALLDYLAGFITDSKLERIDQALAHRTRYLTVVLEDLYQTQNASAVVRTCDCFGIQDLHVIENRNRFKVNKDVAQGASKWVDIHRHGPPDPDPASPGTDRTVTCLEHLRERGYTLVATIPNNADGTLEDLSLEQPLAILFGSEELGLSSTALELADIRVGIPMFGFTRSFNVSVSVAIALYHLTKRLRKSKVIWNLSETEATELKLLWYQKVVKKGTLLARKFLAELPGPE